MPPSVRLQVVSMVDTAFVGRCCGAPQLAGVGIGVGVFDMVAYACYFLSPATTSLVAAASPDAAPGAHRTVQKNASPLPQQYKERIASTAAVQKNAPPRPQPTPTHARRRRRVHNTYALYNTYSPYNCNSPTRLITPTRFTTGEFTMPMLRATSASLAVAAAAGVSAATGLALASGQILSAMGIAAEVQFYSSIV